MARDQTPIAFRDAAGVRWTVRRRPAGRLVRLEFRSEAGERRVAIVLPVDAWAGINELAWQAVLEQASRVA
jgi:hypothetical protein